jgi:hypothetical protein
MLRNRRLALYDTKARYDAPVASLATTAAEETEEAAPRSAPDEPEPQDEGGSGKYAIIGAIAVACGLAAHFFLRKR